jgi:hypothetical protein
MEEEIWKDIPNYEGIYQVSNMGNVKSLKRVLLNHGKHPFFSKEMILKSAIDSTGYKSVRLCKDSKPKSLKVHQLVAVTFLNHIPDGYKIVVDHINTNKLDNRVENLQLITHRENCSKDRTGSSKYTGVCLDRNCGKWRSSIRINGKIKNLGRFSKEQDASLAYQNALKSLLQNNLKHQ